MSIHKIIEYFHNNQQFWLGFLLSLGFTFLIFVGIRKLVTLFVKLNFLKKSTLYKEVCQLILKSRLRTMFALVFALAAFDMSLSLLNVHYQISLPTGGTLDLVVFFIRIINIILTVSVFIIFFEVLTVINTIYEHFYIEKSLSIKSYVQIVKLCLVLAAVIIVIAEFLHRSPWGILTGVGAFSAIILFIFRDALLSFAAGIKLSATSMLQVGDRIEIPHMDVNGDVIAITLYTVKIKNYDNTIICISTQKILINSFKNWSSVNKSGCRRLKHTINIKSSSISFCSPELITKLRGIELLKEFFAHRNTNDDVPNISVFRHYAHAYLKKDEHINSDMPSVVRELCPVRNCMPLELYAFTSKTSWLDYEELQAKIADHLIAMLSSFELEVV